MRGGLASVAVGVVAFVVLGAPSCDPPSGSVSPVGQSGSWALKWSDDFNGSTLDRGKWHDNWHATDGGVSPPVNSAERSCYDAKQVTVGGGALILTLAPNVPARAGCRLRSGATAPLASGLVESDGRFNGYTAGTYVEWRVHLAPGAGTPTNWAAVWTDGAHWPADGEIDVLEVLSGGSMRAHVHDANGGPGSPSYASSAGWHTFAAWRHTSSVDFYYDGARFWSGPIATTAAHYLVANLGQSSGSLPEVPSNLLVDYVRVWTTS